MGERDYGELVKQEGTLKLAQALLQNISWFADIVSKTEVLSEVLKIPGINISVKERPKYLQLTSPPQKVCVILYVLLINN